MPKVNLLIPRLFIELHARLREALGRGPWLARHDALRQQRVLPRLPLDALPQARAARKGLRVVAHGLSHPLLRQRG